MIITQKTKSQYNKCLICKKILSSQYLFCKNHDLFLQDEARDQLIKRRKFNLLNKTYTNLNKTIPNKNTNSFWNKKFNLCEKFENQDGMTIDKIDFIASSLPKNPAKLLDLGIGQGYLEQRLKQLNINYDLFGIDISKTSIERSKKKFSGNFIVGDVINIDKYYKKKSFDVIVAIEVIEHIPPWEILQLYKKMYFLLKPGGILIISTPLNERLTEGGQNPSAHLRRYTIPILRREFILSNFIIKKIKIFYAFGNFYKIKLFLSLLMKNTWEPNNVVILAQKK